MSKHSELKKLAGAAPEGPWFGPEYSPGTGYVFDNCLGSLLHYESIEYEQESCLSYVAAANPAAVLALIAENEALLKAMEKFREAFVIAVGDKSPFAKCALSEVDAAIAISLSPDQPDDAVPSRNLVLTDEQFEQYQKLLKDNPMDENQALQDLLAMKARWSKP